MHRGENQLRCMPKHLNWNAKCEGIPRKLVDDVPFNGTGGFTQMFKF